MTSRICLLFSILLLSGALQAQTLGPSRIAFGSCLDQDKPQPIWNAVYAQRPELFIFLGDNVYADTADRAELAEAYQRLLAHPDFALLKRTCPYIGTWDDHDYGVNDSGSDWPHKQASKEEMFKFLKRPEGAEVWGRPGVYDSYEMGPEGQRVQVILLDTRWFRSEVFRMPKKEAKALNEATGKGPYTPTHDSKATILGEAQWLWLEEQLGKPADLRLICSSIPVIHEETGWETWDNFPAERERLYELLHQTKANGVVLLSGDSHRAEFSKLEGKTPYPLWELNASGLTENARSRPPNKNRLGQMFIGDNFGMIHIDWKRDDPEVTLEVRAEDDDLIMQNTIRLSELQAK